MPSRYRFVHCAQNPHATLRQKQERVVCLSNMPLWEVPHYFPHHRYGTYFVQAKAGKDVVFRQHFDALTEGQAKIKARKVAIALKAKYPGAVWSDGINER